MSYPYENQPAFPAGSGPPRVRFDAISEAWRYLKPQLGVWVGILLIAGILIMGVSFGATLLLAGPAIFKSAQSGVSGPTTLPLGPQLGVNIVTALAQVFLIAGMWRAALNHLRGQTVTISDLFSGGDVFQNVLMYQLALTIPMTLLSTVPIFGLPVVIISGLVLQAFLYFAIPLMVDQRLPVLEAVSRSSASLQGQRFLIVGFSLATGLVSVLGMAACCVGVFVTAPLAFLAQAIVYRDFFMLEAATSDYPTVPPPYPDESS